MIISGPFTAPFRARMKALVANLEEGDGDFLVAARQQAIPGLAAYSRGVETRDTIFGCPPDGAAREIARRLVNGKLARTLSTRVPRRWYDEHPDEIPCCLTPKGVEVAEAWRWWTEYPDLHPKD